MAPMQRPARALPKQMASTLVACETRKPAKQNGKAVEMIVTWGGSKGWVVVGNLSAHAVEAESSSEATNEGGQGHQGADPRGLRV